MTGCKHYNFLQGEILYQEHKMNHHSIQFVCPNCKREIGMSWRLEIVEDLKSNKIEWLSDWSEIKE